MKLQCKHIPDRPILDLLAKNPGVWHNWFFDNELDVTRVFPPNTPEKLMLAKMAMLIRRGLVDGCTCGCRGDFEITDKGLALVEKGV